MLKHNAFRLLVLTLVHFSVDFCGGLTIPLPEPTLVNHLGVDLAAVALLIGGCALVVNVVQPLSGWLLPKGGAPVLLLLAPLAAALTTCIGLTHAYWATALLLLVAAVGIGMVHPEAALAAHSVAGRHHGLGVSIFMSGGYFGFAAGSIVSGVWVEYQGLTNFWWLMFPALAVSGLVLLTGLHRLQGHVSADEPCPNGSIAFALVMALAVSIAVNMCLFVRFITILLVRRFPGEAAQGWGGATVFATGVTGALGAILWSHLAGRHGSARFIALLQLVAVPFLWLALHVTRPALTPVWGLGLGVSLGSVFPLVVVLARQSRGVSQRLRLGLAIGGAWGMGEAAFIVAGKYVATFPQGAVEPVATVLNVCFIVLAVTAALALVVHRQEQTVRARARG